MNRGGLDAGAGDRLDLTRGQAERETLQRVTRGDLRLTALVHVLPDTRARLDSRISAFSFQSREARKVDGLERQAVLKARFNGLVASFELASSLDGLFAPPVGAVALEADGPSGRSAGPAQPAGAAQCFWASAFKLSARKGNPLIFNSLIRCHGHCVHLVPLHE